MSGSLTASELEQLRDLLQRFAEYDFDQCDNRRLEASYGPVFVQLTRQLQQGIPVSAFTTLIRPESSAADASRTSAADL